MISIEYFIDIKFAWFDNVQIAQEFLVKLICSMCFEIPLSKLLPHLIS